MEQPYDISYKISGDYEYWIRQYLSGASFKYVDFPVSVYLSGGRSEALYNSISYSENKRLLNSYGYECTYPIPELNDKVQNKNMSFIIKLCPECVKKFIKHYIRNTIRNYKKRKDMLKSGWSKTMS